MVTEFRVSEPLVSAPPASPGLTAPKLLGRVLFLGGLVAFLLMPMGHGCGFHKHPGDDDDDGVAFRLRPENLRMNHLRPAKSGATKKPNP